MNNEFEQLYEIEPNGPCLDDVDNPWPRINYYSLPAINKKRHQSRKWKKKRGLLKRQRKAAFKRFSKVILKITRAARESEKAWLHFCEATHKLSNLVKDTDIKKGDENE